VEVNLSVWNTTRAIDALAASGWLNAALTEKERERTRDWILAQQTRDSHVYSDAKPGGWGWNDLSGSVPDVDDTSGAILALRHLGVAENHPAMIDGKRWLLMLQNANGGWPTFCRGWDQLPFDRSAPDLTAHAIRALSAPRVPENEWGLNVEERTAMAFSRERGLEYLARVQKKDGSFAPLWFGCEQAKDELNYTYGTTHVLYAIGNAKKMGEAALDWLRRAQNRDGSFGGAANTRGSAEETGLGLRALMAAGMKPDEACCRYAAQWLITNQRADGSWDPSPIGFYFAVLWYYEEMYPLCYALSGLGRYHAALA
jgi:squalene-hopene/tetraprenyl-beta-curcumene cyclase